MRAVIIQGSYSNILYAITFSSAYLSLSAGTGALILAAVRSGERPPLPVWIGVILALGGLVYLVLPGLKAPSPIGSALMSTAGIAWGSYSLRGRGSETPLADTAGNFLYAVLFILSVWLVAWKDIQLSLDGMLLAALSGAIASEVGYVIWYAVLRRLTATRAAIVQLAVPVLAAWGGVILLAEELSLRLVLAAALVLGGIALAVIGRARP